MQTFFRGDHSSNLFHWDWLLRSGDRIVMIQGMNFRTEISISGNQLPETEKEHFIRQMKEHFPDLGAKMGKIRKNLEHWIELVNPYQRIRLAIQQQMDDIASLDLDNTLESIPDVTEFPNSDRRKRKWDEQSEIYNRAVGLTFGVRAMLPVMAESFVNLLLFILMKPELKKDTRLFNNAFRQPIDIRVRSLSHNCTGFKCDVDYENEVCKNYHTLANQRNDLLHGNLNIDKLSYNELYFDGNIPIFMQYTSMWERSFGVVYRSVGLDAVERELSIVNNLVEYLLSCLKDDLCDKIQVVADALNIAVCKDDGRVGVLFGDFLVDAVWTSKGCE